MATKRMFSQKILESDAFYELTDKAQMLYIHLNMHADDDGFFNNAMSIARGCNATKEDLQALVDARFIIAFRNGVYCIKHWKMNNSIRGDRHNATQFQTELSMLYTKENKAYTLNPEKSADKKSDGCQVVDKRLPSGCQVVDKRLTDGCQVVATDKIRLDLDKISLDKVSIDKVSIDGADSTTTADEKLTAEIKSDIIREWNKLALNEIRAIEGSRATLTRTRIKENGIDDFLKAIRNINDSQFLKGSNNRGWIITYDWFIKPSNFIKVLEGNYKDKPKEGRTDWLDAI